MTDIEEKLKQAQQHLAQQEGAQAHDLLISIIQAQPENKAALLMLGGYYFDVGKLAEAEMIFEQLVLLEPGTGQFSIALFNTLWKQQRLDEAFEEIRRFLSVADKTEEQETIKQYVEITRKLAGEG